MCRSKNNTSAFIQKFNKKSTSIKDIIKTVLTNTQLIAVMVYDLFKLIPFYMIAASIAYYCKIVLNDTESVASLLVSFNLGTFIGCMLSNKSVKLVGSKNTNFLGIIGFIICHFVAYLLPTSKITIMLLLGLGQIFFGIAHGNTTNLYSMCSTYSEYKNNKSIKGMAMALCNTSIKVCIVIRGMIITGVLSLINYNPDVARTYEVVNGIKTLFFLIPIGFLILSLIPLIWFKIKDSDIEYMEKIISYNKNN